MAQAFPELDVRRLRLPRRLDRDRARARARRPGVADRVQLRGRAGGGVSLASGYDLVTMFDCLHDMGDPVGAARHVRETLAADGTWMIVEPIAGDRVEDNLNPVGRAYYGVLDAALHAGVAVAGGRARARRAGRRGADPRRRASRAASRASAARPRRRSTSCSRHGREHDRAAAVAPASACALGGAAAARADPRALPGRGGLRRARRQRLFYEVYGEGEETLFLLPTWSIVHSRHWKMQIPYLARHFRVLVMDGLGNGRSDRCRDPRRYGAAEFARDCLAVMDATGTERAVMVALSRGAQYLLELGAARARAGDRRGVHRPDVPVHARRSGRCCCTRGSRRAFDKPLPVYRWWGRMNAVHWREDYAEFAEWFVSRWLPGAALDQGHRGRRRMGARHRPGDADRDRRAVRSTATGRRCARLAGGPRLPGARASTATTTGSPRFATDARWPGSPAGGCEVVRGGGHFPHARKPVQVNLALRDFAEDAFGRRAHTARPHRASPRRPPARAVHLLADRARPRAARRRDRARAAPAAPGPGDRLARPGSGHAGARGRGRAHPSRQRSSRQRVAPHRVRVRRARPALLPGASPDGRDPRRELHALPRRRARASATTCGSGTRRGSSTTTCTRTRARSGRRSRG